MIDTAMTRSLELGEVLSQKELEKVFDTNFGYQIRGINLRTVGDERFVILLLNRGEVYADKIDAGRTFSYIGEGLPEKGDQPKTSANQALIDAIDDPVPIYLFTSEDGVDKYSYEGVVRVDSFEYTSNGERMVYEFEMQKLGEPNWQAATNDG